MFVCALCPVADGAFFSYAAPNVNVVLSLSLDNSTADTAAALALLGSVRAPLCSLCVCDLC